VNAASNVQLLDEALHKIVFRGKSVSLLDELRDAEREVNQNNFRRDLVAAVSSSLPPNATQSEIDFSFVCEVASRLADAEEFQDFIPCHFTGSGSSNRKLRVDGYELDEMDDSIRLLIADFGGDESTPALGKPRAESIFAQLMAFIEECVTGRDWDETDGVQLQIRELSALIENKHRVRDGGVRLVSRYRLYLISDAAATGRLRELPPQYFDDVPVEFHIWDVTRLEAVATSALGAEELEIDFDRYLPGGIPCLSASKTDDYDGYLCVVPADVLARIYDEYGSRLLEGNVRSFLTANSKYNKGIQATLRKEPERFFAYNNGISATASAAVIDATENGPRLRSASYLQIVNGGQTTASLHVAKKKDNANLGSIYVQMKLCVVKADDSDRLDEMIQKIARYANSQTKVTDADFFSNHPFHRAMERRSRVIKAPAAKGGQFNTHWFYERARGQYVNEQSKMSMSERKMFQTINPRAQMIAKTDLAKAENSFMRLPQIVSKGAQKSFLKFAAYVGEKYGVEGIAFDNDGYFKSCVAHIIMFKFVEQMISAARSTWYGGDYRAQIVTYTLALLVELIERKAPGRSLNLHAIWLKQGISGNLAKQLEGIAKLVCAQIADQSLAQRNIGEWFKKDECWDTLSALPMELLPELEAELISLEQEKEAFKDYKGEARLTGRLTKVIEVVNFRDSGVWASLAEWSARYSSIEGAEADLLRNVLKAKWIPNDKMAASLLELLRRMEQEGFNRNA